MKKILPAMVPLFLAACASIYKIDVPPPVIDAPARVKGFVKTRDLEVFKGLNGGVYKHEKSGLEVIIVPQLGTKVVAYVTTYKVGSRNEQPGQTGLAHLFEHMMFRGTPSFPEPFRTLSSWGDRSNATTSFDITQYHTLAPKEVFEDLVKFESERMRTLTINEEIYNIERGAVVSERKMRTEDSPMGRLIWELYANSYKVHPYRVLPIGLQKDLNQIPFQAALDFHKKFYAPNNAVISMVGDVSYGEALNILDRYYGNYESVELKLDQIPKEPVAGRKTQKIVVPQKTESILYGEASLGLAFGDEGIEEYSLMCALLGGGDYGYMHEQLVREQKLASVAGTWCDPGIDKSLNVVFIKANPGVKLNVLEEKIGSVYKSFEKSLNVKKLERIKMLYLSSRWSSLRNPMDLSLQLSTNMTLNRDPLFEIEQFKKIQSVSLDAVIKRFREFQSAPKTKVILNPSAQTRPIEENIVGSFFEPKGAKK